MQENEDKPVSLIYDGNYQISYTIAYFNTVEEAESWREFLAFTMKEYKYNEMRIERKLSGKVKKLLTRMKFILQTIFVVLYIEAKHNYD